ncbi:hypothetical protein [Nocardioides sp. Leaf374]|uniref:hypothetical protein n=1 Tax=Nocardioides sp. Leaf374 TaxID=2876560 RepID=UPI001E529F8F|nr:hypothetical protein [Nocardioides sp. Leaf374]
MVQQAVGVVCGLTGVSPGDAARAIERDAATLGQSPERFAESLLSRWSAALEGDAAQARLALGPLLDEAMARTVTQRPAHSASEHGHAAAEDLTRLADQPRDHPVAATSASDGDPGLDAEESAHLAEALGLPPSSAAPPQDDVRRAPPPPTGGASPTDRSDDED